MGDSLHGSQHLHQIYQRATANFTGRVTVPVLWDTKNDTIVSIGPVLDFDAPHHRS